MSEANGVSLSRRVYEEIRDRIFDGRLAGGEPIRERELGAELDVSRVPIREALPLLAAAGLVSLAPRKPAVVTVVSRTSVDELYDLRAVLEPLAATAAARRVSSGADSARLREAVRGAGAALADGETARFHELSGTIHTEIETLAGNGLYTTVMDPLRERSNRLNVANMERDPSVRHREHEQLVAAIAAGQVGLAGSIAHAHVEWGRERTFQTLTLVPGFDAQS